MTRVLLIRQSDSVAPACARKADTLNTKLATGFRLLLVGRRYFYGRPAQQMRTLYFRPISSFFFFPRLISAVADWMSTIRMQV